MSTVCESCGAPSSSAICWACDDEEYMQMTNDSIEAGKRKREEDIATLRSIVGDECVNKLLSNQNYISDQLLDVDEELLSRVTGKALCPKKKIEALRKRLIAYANDPKYGNAKSLVIECIRRGHIKNHDRLHQDLMKYIYDNFDTSDLTLVMKSEVLKPIFDSNLSKSKNIVTSCASAICIIMKHPQYDKYVTSGRTDNSGIKRSKEEVEANERSLRVGLALGLLISGKDINLKQGKGLNANTRDDKRRQGREYMVACMLVDIYKCMHDKYTIPAPLFGSLFKMVIENCGIKLFIKKDEFIERCNTQVDTFHYVYYKKVMGYIKHMEAEIRKLNGGKNEPYFRRMEPIKRK